MRSLFRRARSPIGIDIGGQWIKAVQLAGPAHAGARPAIAAVVRVPRVRPGEDVTDDDAARLSDVLYRQGFRGSRIVLAAAPDMLLSSALELPPRTSGAPLEDIARTEVSRANKCEPDSFEMECWDLPGLGRPGEGTHVMVAACPHAKADALADLFQRNGLDTAAIDTRGWALARGCAPLAGKAGIPGGSGLSAVLELSWSAGLLVVVSGGVVVFERSLEDAGLRGLHAALHSAHGVDGETAELILGRAEAGDVAPEVRALVSDYAAGMMRELSISLAYAEQRFSRTPPDSLLLVGGGAGLPGLGEALTAGLELPVRPVRPADLTDVPPFAAAACASPSLVAAVGLAQHPADGGEA